MSERSPLGLKPKYIHDEERLKAVQQAIHRYAIRTLEIPIEWVEEYNELLKNSIP